MQLDDSEEELKVRNLSDEKGNQIKIQARYKTYRNKENTDVGVEAQERV